MSTRVTSLVNESSAAHYHVNQSFIHDTHTHMSVCVWHTHECVCVCVCVCEWVRKIEKLLSREWVICHTINTCVTFHMSHMRFVACTTSNFRNSQKSALQLLYRDLLIAGWLLRISEFCTFLACALGKNSQKDSLLLFGHYETTTLLICKNSWHAGGKCTASKPEILKE